MKAGLSQLDLAQKIGLHGEGSDAAISRLEAGLREPRLGKLIQIADALNVPLESLLPV
jgi:transcriptional regulator with XRE-family HTH domain